MGKIMAQYTYFTSSIGAKSSNLFRFFKSDSEILKLYMCKHSLIVNLYYEYNPFICP